MATSDQSMHVAGPALSLDQLHAIVELRVAVFVVEQECAYQEIDGRDLEPDTQHVWLQDDIGIAAYIRILSDPPNGEAARRIGRVVTRPDRRGEKLSSQLIRTSLEQLGAIDTRLEAQSHLTSYYGGFGYEPEGPEFIEDGIPHVPMVRFSPTAPTESTSS